MRKLAFNIKLVRLDRGEGGKREGGVRGSLENASKMLFPLEIKKGCTPFITVRERLEQKIWNICI